MNNFFIHHHTQDSEQRLIYVYILDPKCNESFPSFFTAGARVILDLMADLDQRLAGHDISSQVNFITNKYKEVMQSQDTALSSEQTQVPSGQAEAACSTSDPGASSSGKPKTPLSSLNPLNVPVKLLNLKKSTPVSSSQS